MKLHISLSSSTRVYHIFSKFCANIVSVYWWDTYTFRWYSRISRLEYRRNYHNHAHDYPCIRMIFSQPAHCRTISETPYSNCFFDTLYCRSLYGYYRIFYWRTALPPLNRTLCLDRAYDREGTEKCIAFYSLSTSTT